MLLCCCCKHRVKGNDEPESSDPLMSQEDKAEAAEVGADDSDPTEQLEPTISNKQRNKLKKQRTIGEIEIDDDDLSLSNLVDNYPRLDLGAGETSKIASVGDTSISDLLEEQPSLSDLSGNVPELCGEVENLRPK